tara:strand:- start:192 stop:1052 length:861 start_codon:yes stop_codon:yes gene_type:complete
MISVVGIGNAASAIVDKFRDIPQYSVYALGSGVDPDSENCYKLETYATPEEYEKNIPILKEFFADIRERVQVFVMGASMSSLYALGILEQLKEKQIEVFYVKPDIELLTGIPRLIENATFGILQEYARSGMFKSLTILSNHSIEKIHQNLNIKQYYSMLNETIFSSVHYLNYFEHTDPHIGNVARPSAVNRIRTIAALDVKKLSENWFFELDAPREICYYMCINDERLENEGGLHRKLVDILKAKPRNAFRKLSYAIYETHLPDFGFCVAHTNAIQKNTLDKLEQE